MAERVIELSPRDRHAAAHIDGRPRSTRWARRQLELGHPVTDLLHGSRHLPPTLAQVLALCDGRRSHDELLAVLASNDELKAVQPLSTWLPGALEALRIRALLVSPEAP